MTPPRLLVVGLDGATFDLLLPWVEAGHLPTFARLLQQGSHGRLRSVPNTDTAPAWATFATGLNPANHGLFNEWGWSADRRTLLPAQGGQRHGAAFWQIASQAGQRVHVINVPFTYPAHPLNGILVTGIDAPGENAPHFCYPSDFMTHLRQKGIDYCIDSDIQMAIKENRPQAGIDHAYQVARARTAALIEAMSQEAWQLAVVVYSMPDVMQHFFWQQMRQGTGPQHTTIRESYAFIDAQLAQLIAQAGDDASVIVLSDHGFGPICATPAHLKAWLVQQGFTALVDSQHQSWQQRLVSATYGRLRQQLSERQKAALRRWLPGLRSRVESDMRFADIDWSATTAYVGASPWEVWINRAGREPQGIVPQGIAYEQACHAIITALQAWRDPQTGHKRVRAVHRCQDVYHGRYLELAPDLTIEWNPEAAPAAAALEGNTSQFDADHQPEGIFLAAGPTIAPATTLAGLTLADVAPTILHLLGLSPSEPMDGRIIL